MRRPAELVRVVDGDTLEMRVDLGFGTWRDITVRVLGLDTPETTRRWRKGKKVTAEEVVRGHEAALYANDLLTKADTITIGSSGSRDGRGRWLCDVYYRTGGSRHPERPMNFARQMALAGHVR